MRQQKMLFSSKKRTLTGLEIGASSVKMVQTSNDNRSWRLTRCATLPLPPDIFEPSYSKRNIADFPFFLETVRGVLRFAEGRVTQIGLSLPNEVIKVSIHEFEDPLESASAVEQIVAWREKSTLPFPIEKARISCFPLGGRSVPAKRFLAAIGFDDIINEYQTVLGHIGIRAEIIRPSLINHINFYIESLSPAGIISFLGLFENYFSFFVFEDSRLIFYRGKRRADTIFRFLQELDLTIELFHGEYPEKNIQKIYMGSQAEINREAKNDIRNLMESDLEEADAGRIITIDQSLSDQKEDISVGSYASAIGASLSLGK